MTTPNSTTQQSPAPRVLVDAPAIHALQLSTAQRDGRSCAWCSDWASDRHPIPLLRDEAELHACENCAGLYRVPGVRQ